MSIEALMFLIVFLFLSLLVLAVRWFNEKIRRDIALSGLKDLFLPSDDAREQQEGGVSEARTTSPSKPKQPLPTFSPTSTPKRRTASRFRLRNKADLRQGIIIMTVLGPCRALEHPDD
jgi:Na+-transporting methylmalonyl-CoA/oxaloacetate decarboxylase gamma subunit